MARRTLAYAIGAWLLLTWTVTAIEGQEPAAAEPADDFWITDLAAAREQAAAQGKDLLLNFTGSDWCVWCIRLEDEVFAEAAFRESATAQFVFVKLDFPRDTTGMSEALQAQNEEMKGRFEVSGFPSIYLADAEGRPYAKTGYQEGGPEPYLTHLDELRQIRVQRDEFITRAAETEGQEKAALLDEALSLLDESLVTTHYMSVIEEIVALDADDEAGLRTKYFAAQDAEARKGILAKIAIAARTLAPADAIRTIDEALGEMKLPPLMRIDALQTKLQLLRDLGDQQAIEALLDEMIAMDQVPPEVHERLVVQKFYALVGAGRSEAALELIDTMIGSTIHNLYLYVAKGELLDRLGYHEDAIVTFDEALLAVTTDPEMRLEITLLKSDCLANLGRHDEALKSLEAFAADERINGYTRAQAHIQRSMLLRELGRTDEAVSAEDAALDAVETPEERAELQRLIERIRDID